MSTPTKASAHDDESIDAAIGRRVHQVMWDSKVTQTAFAEMIHMDQSSVAKRLRGKLGWGAKHVAQAAHALDVSIAYLYGETENPHPHDTDGGPDGAAYRTRTDPCALQGRPLAPVTDLTTWKAA